MSSLSSSSSEGGAQSEGLSSSNWLYARNPPNNMITAAVARICRLPDNVRNALDP